MNEMMRIWPPQMGTVNSGCRLGIEAGRSNLGTSARLTRLTRHHLKHPVDNANMKVQIRVQHFIARTLDQGLLKLNQLFCVKGLIDDHPRRLTLVRHGANHRTL